MNPARLEQLLLREPTGELSNSQRRTLDAELAANPDARRRRAELLGLAKAMPPAPTGPAPGAAEAIAARLAREPARPVHRPRWAPALAAAAALALLLGVSLFRGGPAPATKAPALALAHPEESAETAEDDWTDPLEDEFTELESLLLAISDDPFEYIDL
ncbi:MAG: hypothetical protein GX548_09810 [Lentisphaerae bacterium]|nr:hypothetical protein [Lentisphaerota bacterium]